MSQRADASGSDNIIVQVRGDGNTVLAGLPHLTLTRYLARRRQPDSEIALLNPFARRIPLIGRGVELAELWRWLRSAAPISIRVLTARGGTGKTRLALEVCDQAAGEEWDAGFVTPQELERFQSQQNLSTWGWRRPTLVVVDYAAAQAARLRRWFAELANNPADARPMRVLVLERHADPARGWWETAFGGGGWEAAAIRALLDPPDGPMALSALAAANDRRAVLTAVLERVGTVRLPAPREAPGFDRQLTELIWGGEPLFLIMAGLTMAKEGIASVLALSRVDIAFQVADNELARIGRFAPTHNGTAFLQHLASYATLCGGLDRQQAFAVIGDEKRALSRESVGDPHDIYAALAAALPGDQDGIAPVLPDALGEAVMLRALGEGHTDAAVEAVTRASTRSWEQVSAAVIRTAQDYGAARPEALRWLDRLVQQASADRPRLQILLNQMPQSTSALRESAAVMAAGVVQMLRADLAAGGVEDGNSALAWSLVSLGQRLGDVARRNEALQAVEEAVALCRELVAAHPDKFSPALAMSLGRLGRCLGDLRRWDLARRAFEEAVALYRELVVSHPETFRPLLAQSLGNLSLCLNALHRPEDALGIMEEAMELDRELAATYPDAYRAALAMSLSNVTTYLGELARLDEALLAVEEAVELFRELAAANPDAYRAALAMSLHNRSRCLAGLQRWEQALQDIEEVVAIRRELTAAHSDAFRPSLGRSLASQSAYLGELARPNEALQASEDAVEIFRELAEAEPSTFGFELAMSLRNLCRCLGELNCWEEALQVIEEAVAVLSPIFLVSPAAFAAEMGYMVDYYLALTSKMGRVPNNVLVGPIRQAMEGDRKPPHR